MRCSAYGKPRLVVAGLAVAVATAACGGVTGSPVAGSRPSPFTDGPTTQTLDDEAWSPDKIARAEILSRGSNEHTAMGLVRRLRPAWLRARGQKSFTDPSADYPVVYIDAIRRGGLSTLYQIPSSEILSLQFFGTADATTRWGTGHPSGCHQYRNRTLIGPLGLLTTEQQDRRRTANGPPPILSGS